MNISVCLTEEAPHVSSVNPVKLTDKEWTDPYKLRKLLMIQKTSDGDRIFGQFSCPF